MSSLSGESPLVPGHSEGAASVESHPPPPQHVQPDDRIGRAPHGRGRIQLPSTQPIGKVSVSDQLLKN